MRVGAVHLGLGQVNADTCAAVGGVWNSSTNVCSPQPPIGSPVSPPSAPAGPSTPVGYDPSTGTIAATNTSGQTIATLPASSSELCGAQGGEWETASSTCNYSSQCTQFPFGGTFNTETGECSYMNFYLTIGGVALFAFVLIAMARK